MFGRIDWMMVFLYVALCFTGWLHIWSASFIEDAPSPFSMSNEAGRQFVWMCISFVAALLIMLTDAKIFPAFRWFMWVPSMILLASVLFIGQDVAGNKSWIVISGNIKIQPSEFAKSATALALAKYLSDVQVNLREFPRQLQALGILALPILLIVPNDPGSALIFTVLILVLYREGLPAWYVWTGFVAIILFVLALLLKPLIIILLAAAVIAVIYVRSRIADRNIIMSAIILVLISGFVFSVDYVFDNVFKQHHRDRFNILLGKEVDLKGVGYNTNQSEIAIGSGGWFGKGYLEGTQTKGGFVPEQHTDYIFTTVGEEWGFVGSMVVIALFVSLIIRIIWLAERQKTKFSRVYGYCVACVLFIHFFVNVAMVLGIFPTIGVPLPLFSYGGSGLWGFTILLFIFLKMDANKVNEW